MVPVKIVHLHPREGGGDSSAGEEKPDEINMTLLTDAAKDLLWFSGLSSLYRDVIS